MYAVEIQNYCALTCLVPSARFELARLSATVPKTAVSPVPPGGHFSSVLHCVTIRTQKL